MCVSWNGVEEPVLRVEGRGLELRVEGWRMRELESEYEITRRYSSSLHELHDKYMSYRNT